MSEFLEPPELRKLTDRAGREAQRERLAEIGVPFRVVGSQTLVSRHHVRAWLRGETLVQSAGPRLDLVR